MLPSSLAECRAYDRLEDLILTKTRRLRRRNILVLDLMGPFRNFVDQSGDRPG